MQSVKLITTPAPPGKDTPYSLPTRHNEPFEFKCYNCGHEGLTRVQKENSCLQWLLAILLAATGFILGCCLVPFYVD